jgi:hypothetical protein
LVHSRAALRSGGAEAEQRKEAVTGKAPSLIGASVQLSRRLHRKKAADYIGTSLSWLDKSRLRGDGPAFLQIGGRVVYDTADLDDFLSRCRRRSTSQAP